MKAKIAEVLMETFWATSLKISDDSHLHAHHREGSNQGNTHFSIEMVSDSFSGVSLVKRHRLVYEALDDFIKNGVHALKLTLKSPSEIG